MPDQWPPPLTPVTLHDGHHNFATKALASVEHTLNVRAPDETAPTLIPGARILLRWSTYLGMLQRECVIQAISATKLVLESDQTPSSIQRRQYYRGQVMTKVLVDNIPGDTRYELSTVGQSVDLSEGGMLIAITDDTLFEPKQEVTLRFVIDDQPLYVTAGFLRSQQAFRGIRASFRFLNASADVMNTIRKCVFESQLDKSD